MATSARLKAPMALTWTRVAHPRSLMSRLPASSLFRDQAGEVERLLASGATEVQWDKRPPDSDYVIVADPEGNRFCVHIS